MHNLCGSLRMKTFSSLSVFQTNLKQSKHEQKIQITLVYHSPCSTLNLKDSSTSHTRNDLLQNYHQIFKDHPTYPVKALAGTSRAVTAAHRLQGSLGRGWSSQVSNTIGVCTRVPRAAQVRAERSGVGHWECRDLSGQRTSSVLSRVRASMLNRVKHARASTHA